MRQKMAVEISEMKLEDYENIHSLWKSAEGIGLHDDSDSKGGVAIWNGENRG